MLAVRASSFTESLVTSTDLLVKPSSLAQDLAWVVQALLFAIVTASEVLRGRKLDMLASACIFIQAHLFAAFSVTLTLALVLIDGEARARAVVYGQFARSFGRLTAVETIVFGLIDTRAGLSWVELLSPRAQLLTLDIGHAHASSFVKSE